MVTNRIVLLVVYILVVVVADWVNMLDDSQTSNVKCVLDTLLLFFAIGLIQNFGLLFLGQIENHSSIWGSMLLTTI